eukprot:RCo020888
MDIQAQGSVSSVATPLPQNSTYVDSRRSGQGQEVKDTSHPAQGQGNAQPSREDVAKAASQVSKFVSPVNTDIQFSIDNDTDMTVVKVIDKSTKEVIRQIPGEEILQIAKALDRLQGLLVKQQA